MASFLLARLNHELSRATCYISNRYTCKPFSPNFSLSPEVSSSNVKLHVNTNCPAVLTKGFAIKGCADEGALISFSKYSNNSFSQFRANWLLNSNLLTSGLCCVAQFRRFLDTPRSNFFRQLFNSFVVSGAIHQERALFLYNPFSRGSLFTCVPMLWCCFEIHSLPTSTSHIFPLVEFLFAFTF